MEMRMTIDNFHEPEFDVAIVGYGPVGQALAALLGRAGHRVAVFERFGEIYRLPRAVHLDHEIMRLLQSLGLSEVLAEELVPVDDYRWFGADGDLLMRFEPHSPALSGWETDYMFFQPELERAMEAHACVPAGVTVARGWAAEGLVQFDDRVELTLRRVTEEEPGRLALTGETRTVSARWVVGAGGAILRARPRSCRAARGTGGGSSCCSQTSGRPISKIRTGCGRCSSRGIGRRTGR